jgi:hypothetical protein
MKDSLYYLAFQRCGRVIVSYKNKKNAKIALSIWQEQEAEIKITLLYAARSPLKLQGSESY